MDKDDKGHQPKYNAEFMAMITEAVEMFNRRQDRHFDADVPTLLNILSAIDDLKTGYGCLTLEFIDYRLSESRCEFSRRYPKKHA